MKDRNDLLQEKTLKLIQIQALCDKMMVRVPASVSQASTKAMAMAILRIINDESV